MFFITIILALIIFRLLKDKLELNLTKSIKKLALISIMLLIACVVNILYNWDYFKQYSGVKTTEYYLAYNLWYITGYGLLGTTTILIASVILNISRKQNDI